MTDLTRRTALTAIFGAGLWAGTALAQEKDLTVEVAPHHVPHRHPVYSPRPRPAGPVQVSLAPIGPSTISIGQPLKFRMLSLADGYGHLYVLSASGRSQVWLENIRVHAGAPIFYPRPGLIVRAAAPAGDETVMFVTTRGRIAGFLDGRSSASPFDLQYTHDGFRAALQNQLDPMSRDDWAVAELTIRVED